MGRNCPPCLKSHSLFQRQGAHPLFKAFSWKSELSASLLDCWSRHKMKTQQEQHYLARMISVSWGAAPGSELPAADMAPVFLVQFVFWQQEYIWGLLLLRRQHFHELITYSANPSSEGHMAHRACQVNLLILLPEACCAIVAQSQTRCD